MRATALAIWLAIGAVTSAQTMADVEKLRQLTERKAQLEKAMKGLSELQQAAEAAAQEKAIECLGAVGHQQFCTCLGDNIPLTMNFQLYAVLLSKGRESFGYPDKVSAEDREQMDAAYAAREQCVAAAFGKPK